MLCVQAAPPGMLCDRVLAHVTQRLTRHRVAVSAVPAQTAARHTSLRFSSPLSPLVTSVLSPSAGGEVSPALLRALCKPVWYGIVS